MSPQTVLRYVQHRIVQHPDIEATYEGACQSCNWKATPSGDKAAVDIECMSHTGRSNHRVFRRNASDLAFVVRDGEEDPVR
ncbi:hypothetical protein K388_00305 [Streptomyces sp. KhCrAH-43]|uniref:DUF7848 domain-containing protein n=1 Tax=unclassified Streptomyces TaxID=2593676 RepID=UPI00037F4CD8|nr:MULTISPECIES: hypothetical protein [unclassified Streptomyces]MYS37895.1 hypothetical protein [Streptomyces sp. SID4920]MYX66083.1 hypothetical protein [Streptomyces sp. SID8373]RAJ67565.1 hypothetical protein K388_00305 [Streptomyces sp. KhCrAH-43]